MAKRYRLTGRKKAAILMIFGGPEIAADVFRLLSDEEIEQLTLEISNLGAIPKELNEQVVETFYHTALAKQTMTHGGISTARLILELALGPAKAMEIIEHLQGMLQGTPFDFLKKVDPNYLYIHFVKSEHPQIMALILAYLDPKQSAVILSNLPVGLAADVTLRISLMEQVSPEIINEIERVLERKIATILSQEFMVAGGIAATVEILDLVDRTTEETILNAIEKENQELAVEIKKLRFTYNDITMLDDRAIQSVLKEVDMKTLAIALNGSNEDIKEKIFNNVSSRAAENIREEMEFMGQVSASQLDEVQKKIVAVIRRMEETGELIIQHD